ncbi:MAG: lysophospholipid acyltransferase family protein [Saprospiraceae bacterium]
MKKRILKALSWITTIPFLLVFGLILVVFHPLQMLGLRLGYQGHKKVVDGMVWCLNNGLLFSGNYMKFINLAGDLPTDRPMIIISNHQSMFDIPAIGWALKAHHPKFVAKKELEKGFPSISYNVRNGGSITIDRKDKRQAIKAILEFTEYLNKTNRAGCIFAEGRRAKDGKMRSFKRLGVGIMLKKMPNATVIPVAIENFWHLEEHKLLPVPFGYQYRCTILPALDRNTFDNESIIEEAEQQIRNVLKQPKQEVISKN